MRERALMAILVIGGLGWLAFAVDSSSRVLQSQQVKSSTITLPEHAFDDDPQLQKAVQNLQQTQQPAQQQPVGPAPTDSANMLQPGSGL